MINTVIYAALATSLLFNAMFFFSGRRSRLTNAALSEAYDRVFIAMNLLAACMATIRDASYWEESPTQDFYSEFSSNSLYRFQQVLAGEGEPDDDETPHTVH